MKNQIINHMVEFINNYEFDECENKVSFETFKTLEDNREIYMSGTIKYDSEREYMHHSEVAYNCKECVGVSTNVYDVIFDQCEVYNILTEDTEDDFSEDSVDIVKQILDKVA